MGRRAWAAVATAAIGLSSCSLFDIDAEPDAVPAANWHTDSAERFATAAAMRDRFDKIAVFEVMSEEWRGKVNAAPRVIFELRVVDAVKNTAVDEIVRFTQPDKSKAPPGSLPPEIHVGRRYLMFLVAVEGKSAGDGPGVGTYSTFLGETVYRRSGANAWKRYFDIDPPQAASTPAAVTDAELDELRLP